MEKYKINSNSDILFRFIIIALMVNQSLLMALRNQNSRIVTFRAFRLSVMSLTYVILTEKVILQKCIIISCGNYFYPDRHDIIMYKNTKKVINVVNVEFLFKVYASTFLDIRLWIYVHTLCKRYRFLRTRNVKLS